MNKDYSTGRYIAYALETRAPCIASLENGLMRSNNGTWLFRIEGNQIYAAHPKGSLQGFIDEDGVGRSRDGKFLFRLETA